MHFHFLCFALMCSRLALLSTAAPSYGFCSGATNNSIEDDHRSNIELVRTIRSAQVLAPTFSEERPADPVLFGNIRDILAEAGDLDPYEHPRVIVGSDEWDEILTQHADNGRASRPGTWSHYFRRYTLHRGPFSPMVGKLYNLERDGSTKVYDGRVFDRSSEEYEEYRKRLAPLAAVVKVMNPLKATSLFLCAFWAEVSEQTDEPFLGPETHTKCILAIVAWSKALLAHRAFFCKETCPFFEKDSERLFIWNTEKLWEVDDDSYSAGSSLALAYDVLYDRMSENQREVVRSALALLVMKKTSWGTSERSTEKSPSSLESPHRIMSYSALRHSYLYITNLAIEGETGFDRYTSDILSSHGSEGFNRPLHQRFSALITAYMTHGVYPDGSFYEDGRTLFKGLREGALGLIASHRRGSGVLSTGRFRNMIHVSAQMHEPWPCGEFVGHTGGGGNGFNAFLGLFKYAYPHSEVAGMLWRQRFNDYANVKSCRIDWWQSMIPLAFLGSDHVTSANSIQEMRYDVKQGMKLSLYATRRGLLVARNGHSERDSYLHFDARPDAFFFKNGHADRGTITFSSLKQTWLPDIPRSPESHKHSILHIDGTAQDRLAPAVKMLRVSDNGRLVLAAADLTYAYNFKWASRWNSDDDDRPHPHYSVRDGSAIFISQKFFEKSTSQNHASFEEEEKHDPWELGWPADDRGVDIGLSNVTKLHSVSHIGPKGLFMWKRQRRARKLEHVVRSVGLIRSTNGGSGMMIIVDSADAGNGAHLFSSYMVLNRDVGLEEQYSFCENSFCKICFRGKGVARLDVHVFAQSKDLTFEIHELQDGYSRLVVSSKGLSSEEIWVLLCPHEGKGCQISLDRTDEGATLSIGAEVHRFALDEKDHGIVGVETPPMVPRAIEPSQAYGLEANFLQGNKETHLHRMGAPLQAVFTFRALSRDSGSDRDEIRTCSRFTQMKTHIAVYYCGERNSSQKYASRKCQFVSETGERDSCNRGSQRSVWSGKLNEGHRYYAAVSGYPLEGLEPRLSVVHLRRVGW